MSDFQASPELLTIYLEDARSHLEALDHCLLALEREGLDSAVLAAVVGPLHTLKGNSGMMGFSAIKEYVHRLEDVFGQIADGGLTLTPAAFDQLFAGASALRDAVERACARRGEARDLGPEKAVLDNLLRQADGSAPPRPAVAGGGAPAPAAAPAAPRWEYATLRFDVVKSDWVWTTQDEVKRGEKPRLFKQMGGYGREMDHEVSIVDLATQAGTYGWELTTVLERDKGGTEVWFKRPLR